MAKLAQRTFLLSFIIGVATTALIYQLLPILPDKSGLIARYLTGHPLEFAIVALGMVGCVELALRSMSASTRRHAIVDAEDRLDLTATADDWRKVSADASDTSVVRRLTAFADLRDRNASKILDHAQKLTDRAADDLAAGYAPLMTILWAIPIVGFLGTVMGITIAVANISPDQLENSLGNVTGGLAVAFDTTALALGLSLVLGFATLFVRRGEERLLSRLDDLADNVLVPTFSDTDASNSPSLAVSDATAQLLVMQMAKWNEALDQQREAFASSLQSGHQHFVEAWADIQVNAIENQRLTWETSSDQLGDAMADWQARFQKTLEGLSELVPKVITESQQAASKHFEQSMQEIREHTSQTTHNLSVVSDTLVSRAESTESLISRCEQLATDVAAATAEQNRDWNSVATKTAALTEMQQSINAQLGKAGVAEQLDETLHQLTAAVHMLTARARHAA